MSKNPLKNANPFQHVKLMTAMVAGSGLACWGIAAFGAFNKWAWSEPVTLSDLGLLVVLVTAGALLLRASEDVNRRLKARKLQIPTGLPPKTGPEDDPENDSESDPESGPVADKLKLRLITTFTDANGTTADPLIVIRTVQRRNGELFLTGTVGRQPACIPLSSVAKIKDVETGAVIHEAHRTWLYRRLDGWTGKSGGPKDGPKDGMIRRTG